MRKRLNRLEKSILSMMSSEEKTSSYKNSYMDVENSLGTTESLSQAGGQRISVDTRSTHWDAILHDVGLPSNVFKRWSFILILCSLER